MWFYSSKKGHERDPFHHFLMDYDFKEQPPLDLNPLNAKEYSYQSFSGNWHVIRRATLTETQYLTELRIRNADPMYRVMLQLNQVLFLACPMIRPSMFEDLAVYQEVDWRKAT